MKLKKNNVKRKLAIMFAVLWLFPLTVYADVIPEQTEYIYVNDFISLLLICFSTVSKLVKLFKTFCK